MKKLLLTLGCLCFIGAALITSVDICSFDRGFYDREYAKLGVAEYIGISDDELQTVTTHLLDYIKDKHDDLTINATIKGEVREVFNEKEKLHMVDVKNLYLNVMTVRNVLLIAVVLILAYSLYKGFFAMHIKQSYGQAFAIAFGVVLALGLYAITDFENFWLSFHYIFFTNDLFFLDPTKDILIMMVPEQFFFDLVMRITATFVVMIAALPIGLWIKDKMKARKAS